MCKTCARVGCNETEGLDWYYTGSSMCGVKALCCPQHGKEWEDQ